MSIKAISNYGLSIIAVSLLSACGSSDDNKSTQAVNNNQTPIIVDSGSIPKTPIKTPIEDNQAPSLSLYGSNPQKVTLGSSFVDQGAYANDSVDGDLSSSITSSDNVNTSVAGCYQQSYLVSDNSGNSRSISRTVLVGTTAQRHSPNTPPTTIEISVTSTNVKSTTLNLLNYATDADCDNLTVTNVSEPLVGSVTRNSNATLTFDPQGNVGSHFFTYTVSDKFGGSSTSGVTIASTDPTDGNDSWPSITGEDITISKNTSILIDVLANDIDADGDILILDGVDDPENGSIQKINGKVYYTPDLNYVGQDSFYYGVHDGHGHNGSGLVNIQVVN